jgi:hypothetical protein
MAGVRITEFRNMENDSLGFMNYQSGEIGLGFMVGVFGTDTFSLRLNTSSIPMTPTDAFGSYTEPSGTSGYAPITGPLFGLTLVSNVWNAEYDSAIWSLQSHTGDTVTVYGWWYQDDGGTLIAAGNISPPFVAPLAGATLTVSPIILTLGSCTPGGPPPPPPGAILLDHFVDSNGTLLQLHTPNVGGPWSVYSSGSTSTPSITIMGNTALPAYSATPASDGQTATVVAVADSITVTVTGIAQSGQYIGAVLRLQDHLNLWVAELNCSGNQLLIDEFVGGSYNSRNNVSLTITPPESVTVSFNATGTLLTATGYTGSGSAQVTYTSSDYLAALNAGLRQGSGAGGLNAITFTRAEITSP